MTISVTTLVENTVNGRNLKAEHGLSYAVQTRGRTLLFDTGQSDLLAANAHELQIALGAVEAVVLSHGHYDHTGGLSVVRRLAPRARLYLHPAAVLPKYVGDGDGTSRPVGLTEASARVLAQAGASVVWTRAVTEVLDGIFVTGAIPRTTAYEDVGGRFFSDEACAQPDPLPDDQALFFDTCEGIVVLLGCAHAGVVNTLQHIRQLTPGRPLHSVLGGMHLLDASAERMQATVTALKEWNPHRLGPAHCTGWDATVQLAVAFPGRCAPCPVGHAVRFER